jgi:rare lipoprotein A
VAVTLTLAAAGCGSTSRSGRAPVKVEPAPGGELGMASYYSNHLAGRRTASGERYDPDRMTAAHRRLPFGTRVRVTRVDERGRPSGESVEVRVNDRGPYSAGRMIDLSMAAAKRLGMLRAGVVRVRLQVLDR